VPHYTNGQNTPENNGNKPDDSVVGELFFTLLVIACALLMILTTNLPTAHKLKALRLKEKALVNSCEVLYRANEKLEREIEALAGSDPFYIEGEIRKAFKDVRPAAGGEGGS